MEFPSNEATRILEFLQTSGETPEDKLPPGYAWELLPHLVSSQMVQRFSVLAPGQEPKYPYGLWAYRISSSGVEVLNKFRDEAKKEAKQNSKEKRRAFWGTIKFWVGLIVGWILGSFTPQQAFEWIGSLFH